jgi:hypothetical protein
MIKSILKMLGIVIVFIGIIILYSTPINAQVRPRGIKDSIQASYNGTWYNLDYNQFEIQYPKLTYIPPITTDMNFETLLAYIYLDSLMRNTNRDLLYMNYLTRWTDETSKNDTIVQAVKYLYKLVDYDPVRFVQYDCNLGYSYKISVMAIRGWVGELLSNIIGRFGTNSLVMDNLIRADYILKVHVNFIDSLPQRDYPPTKGLLPGKYIHRVNATVIDTLKGRVFKNCYEQSTIHEQEKSNRFSSEICFTYGTGPYANDVVPFKLDPSLINSSGNLQLQSGQDLIVVLDHSDYVWNYNYDYLPISLITVYPIIGGKVRDISHVWSSSSTLDYADWKTIFFQKRDLLLSGGY